MALLGLFFMGGGGFVMPIILMIIATKHVGRMLNIIVLSLLTFPFLYGQHRYNQVVAGAGFRSGVVISGAESLLIALTAIIVIWACALIVVSRKEF